MSAAPDTEMLNAPYPSCHSKFRAFSNVSLIHFDDPPLINCIALDTGMVAGKTSGVVDPNKWCALCERDGHDSVDCPFEEAYQ